MRKTEPKIILTPEQQAELDAYIKLWGRGWRSYMADDWYYCRPSGLIWLRNTPGGHKFIANYRAKR